MGSRTYPSTGLVIRKTKLGETDIIVTMLSSQGTLIKGVAKGARKPGSTFSARLEMFSICDCLFVAGRSLDIIKEARIDTSFQELRENIERTAAAESLCEVLCSLAQTDLKQPVLFEFSKTALKSLTNVNASQILTWCAAALSKAYSLCGYRPLLERCSRCDDPITYSKDGGTATLGFSIQDGGVICSNCSQGKVVLKERVCHIGWLSLLLHSTFAEIETFECPVASAKWALTFCDEWSAYHVGTHVKSLGFLLTLSSH